MKNRKELILPGVIVVILIAVPAWILFGYAERLFFYESLYRSGVTTRAVLLDKGLLKDGRTFKTSVSKSSDNHRFLVGFVTENGMEATCSFSVSKNTWDVIGRRDELSVTYLPDDPSQCTLPHSMEINRLLSFSLIGVALFLLIVAAGFFVYIYRSFKRPPPDKPVQLTTHLDLSGQGSECPRCGEPMTEGYMPTVGGVSWRDRGDPVGIPSMLTGLPGTAYLIKRPKLHAYRCEDCRIITFKYGK